MWYKQSNTGFIFNPYKSDSRGVTVNTGGVAVDLLKIPVSDYPESKGLRRRSSSFRAKFHHSPMARTKTVTSTSNIILHGSMVNLIIFIPCYMTNHIKQRLDFLICRREEGSLFFNGQTVRQLLELQMEIA